MPRVIQLIQNLGFGGLEVQAHRLALLMGSDQDLVGYDRETPIFAPLGTDLTTEFKSDRLKFLQELRQIQGKADIVHTHAWGPLFWSILAGPARCRRVHTIHSELDIHIPLWLKVLKPWLLRQVNILTVPSLKMQRRFPQSHLAPNLPANPNQQFSRPTDVPLGLYDLWVGRLEAPKDPLLVSQAHPRDVPLLFLGDGPLRNDLLATEVLGFRGDPTPYLFYARKIILASLSESAPLAIIEALSLSKQVVVSSTGDMTDWLTTQPARGILVLDHTLKAWQAALSLPLPGGPIVPVVDYQSGANQWKQVYDSL